VQESKGRLNLDDDIRKFLTGFKLHDDSDERLSLRSLGSHLSGMGRDSMFL
jgi:CubicO group peptidase (beta-lactamase class C family)